MHRAGEGGVDVRRVIKVRDVGRTNGDGAGKRERGSLVAGVRAEVNDGSGE